VTRGDSLDLVIERAARSGSPPLDQGELFSLTYLLSVAGVGNIANILCAAMWALAEYPGWLEQLDDELGDFKPLDLKQGVGRFPILRAVISEVERCYLPAPVIPKMTATEINFMGYRIPAGVDILQLHGLAHFQADRYDDPLSFRPDRWLVGDASRANAFGGGIHLCLGMGVTRLYVPLVLALLARDHSWATKEPPRLVPQLADLPFSPETTRFDAALT
jgi:cytochrome P450 monooxygenase